MKNEEDVMQKSKKIRSLIAIACWTGAMAASALNTTAPDNSARNAAVGKPSNTTADDQGNSKGDIDLTAKIRRALVDDESLSVNAQNVKIITNKGQVVLKGPVANESERQKIFRVATSIAGGDRVRNELEVHSKQGKSTDEQGRGMEDENRY